MDILSIPKGNGKWYKGQHEPIITKEIFEKVREKISSECDYRSNNKEFAFTNLFTCGLCNSGISAREKVKKLKNGKSLSYVYYGCTKSKDKNCKNGYVREELIIKQLIEIIDKVGIDEKLISGKLKLEIDRFNSFYRLIYKDESKDKKEVDIKDYAKHVLLNGSTEEKREVVRCFSGKIILKNKLIKVIENNVLNM